uniref:Protein bassoon n=1 Tax=Lygus hesperus TaxID=30085 RepID=A0A0A9WQ69_LYGHE
MREMVRAVTGSATDSSSTTTTINGNHSNDHINANTHSKQAAERRENGDSDASDLSSPLSDNANDHHDHSNNDYNHHSGKCVNAVAHKHYTYADERFENEGGNFGHYTPPKSHRHGQSHNHHQGSTHGKIKST